MPSKILQSRRAMTALHFLRPVYPATKLSRNAAHAAAAPRFLTNTNVTKAAVKGYDTPLAAEVEKGVWLAGSLGLHIEI